MKTIFLTSQAHALAAVEYLIRHHADFCYELDRSKPDTPHRFTVPGWLVPDLENFLHLNRNLNH